MVHTLCLFQTHAQRGPEMFRHLTMYLLTHISFLYARSCIILDPFPPRSISYFLCRVPVFDPAGPPFLSMRLFQCPLPCGLWLSRQRVVPLSLIPSCMTRKETRKKKMAVSNPGAGHSLLAPRSSRGHFFSRFSFASRTTD